jgi:hypothetical protein
MTDQKHTEQEARRVVEGGEADRQSQQPGDNRTPGKTIGQVKYADNQGGDQKNQGGSSTSQPKKESRAND